MSNYRFQNRVFLAGISFFVFLSGCEYSSDRLQLMTYPSPMAGTVAKSPEASAYTWGTWITVEAVPREGWEFVEWNGTISNDKNPVSVPLITDIILAATFRKIPQHALSCTESYPWEWEIDGQPIPCAEQLAAWEDEVYHRVNAIRQAHGLCALVRDTCVNRVARDHSRTMAATQTLAHEIFPGENHGVRLHAAGLLWKYSGENLARFSCMEDNFTGRCVDGWMNSVTHTEVILTEAYTHTGVGIALDDRDIAYITQNFVTYHPITTP